MTAIHRSIRKEARRYADTGIANGSTRQWLDLYHERYRQLVRSRNRIGRTR